MLRCEKKTLYGSLFDRNFLGCKPILGAVGWLLMLAGMLNILHSCLVQKVDALFSRNLKNSTGAAMFLSLHVLCCQLSFGAVREIQSGTPTTATITTAQSGLRSHPLKP